MMGGEDPVLPFEELQTDPRIGRVCGIGAQRIVRGLQDDRGWRVDSGARVVEQAANAVRARDRRHTFNQFRQRHWNAIDRDGQSGFKRDLKTRGRVWFRLRHRCRGTLRRSFPQCCVRGVHRMCAPRASAYHANQWIEGLHRGFDLRVILFAASVRDQIRGFDTRNLDKRSCDQPARHVVPGTVPCRRVAERGRNAGARELVARVEDVSTNGAGRERRLAGSFQFICLAQVERERHDLRVELFSQLRYRGDVVGSAGARKHDARRHAGCPSPVIRSNRFTSALARRASGATMRTVSSPATVPTTSGRWASSMLTQSAWARPSPVLNSTSCCTRSTRNKYSAIARCSIASAVLPFGVAPRPGGWYAPSAPPFTSPSSRMSRESVACVTSKPAARRLRRSCSWLRTGARWMTSRITD